MNKLFGRIATLLIVSACLSCGANSVTKGSPVNPRLAPRSPSDLSVRVASCSQIDLAWTDNSSDETEFVLERKIIGGDFGFVRSLSPDETSTSDTGLTPSTSYQYRIKAMNSAGGSDWATSSEVTTQPAPLFAPNAPTGLTATALDNARIQLAWVDNSGNEQWFAVEQFNGVSFATVATLNATVVRYEITGLSANTAYSFRVQACNLIGCSTYTNVAGATTATAASDTTPPSQVGNVVATATSSSSIRVTWSAATDPGSPTTGIQGYIVYRNGVRANTPLVVGLFFDDTGRAPSTTYSYRVNAVDGATPAHEGQLSVAASATTTSVPDTTPPSQVTNVIATATNSSSIRVTWSAATDPGSPTTGIQGYIVYRNGVRANTPLVVGLFFDDTGRAPSTTYSYRVSAVDGATPANEGQQSDVASATTSATPDTTAPNLVTGLVATGTGPNQITLSWIANTESDLKGYLVYCGSEPDPVATVFAPLTSFIHTGLTPSTTYSYRVSAVDTATPQNEGPLAEVTATTLPTTMPTPSAPTNLTRGPLLPEDRWREWDAYDLYWTDYCNLDLNWGRPANYVDLPGEIITFTIAYGNHFEVHRATQSLESALTFNVTIDNALVSAPVSDPWYFCITPKHGETVGVSAKIGVYASSCATFVVSTLTGCP